MNKLLFLFFLFPFFCEATVLKPWFGSDHEVEIRSSVLYQNYSSIAIPHHRFRRHANDVFMTLSATYPFRRYCGEFEATVANTRHQNYRWDNYRVTGRYQVMNELDGSPITLTAGITLGEAFSLALHDVSSFHHGHLEGEFHLSFGKKYGYPCSHDYIFRWWNVFGIGTSDIGSPWLREEIACEYNDRGVHQWRCFAHTLWGVGQQNLRYLHFKGYGSINHQSVDVGVRYGYTIDCWGTLSIQYARRVYASNFPQNANLTLVELYIPFGIQSSAKY
jgi:hypothetical protein